MSTPAPTTHAADAPNPPPPNPPFRGDFETEERGNKEGGPTGRAVSARNATTHGLFARDVVLPALGEDPAAFDALLTQFCQQLPPRNLLERHYLEQIAAASWRLRRLHRWQAQVYEDDTITEDQRLDKLDKVLRHETALTRQIDRAVRTLNRDLKWLFEGRAREEAHYQRDLTPAEVRAEPELGIEVQRLIWKQLRPAPAPDLAGARLDNTAEAPDNDHTTQNCENEAFASDAPPPASLFAPVPPPFQANDEPPTPQDGAQPAPENCQNEPAPTQNCQNEPALSLGCPPWNATPTPPELGAGGPPQPHEKCENEVARQKRLQEIIRRFDPNAPALDWDSDEMRQAYGAR